MTEMRASKRAFRELEEGRATVAALSQAMQQELYRQFGETECLYLEMPLGLFIEVRDF